MRFPFRLSAGLFKAKLSGFFAGASAAPPIFRFNPCVTHLAVPLRFNETSTTELEWHSPAECAARVRSIASPVVWIGGTEPLLHAEIGAAADAIVETNRFAFVHTSGYNLRQRIHELRPDSRLFLTLEFAGREEAHNKTVGRPDAFRLSMEAIRAAKLSGFLVAAHVTVTRETDACDIGELIEFLDNKDVDGFVVTSGGQLAAEKDSALQQAVEESRTMIRCGRWERFSKLLDASFAEVSAETSRQKFRSTGEGAFEEGD